MTASNPKNAMEACPKFSYCNFNKCPLSENYAQLENSPEDFAIRIGQRCVEKQVRKKLAKQFNLASGGLTTREQNSATREASLSPEQKALRNAKLRELSPFVQLKAKGYAITRVGKDNPDLHGEKALNAPESLIKTSITGIDELSQTPFNGQANSGVLQE